MNGFDEMIDKYMEYAKKQNVKKMRKKNGRLELIYEGEIFHNIINKKEIEKSVKDKIKKSEYNFIGIKRERGVIDYWCNLTYELFFEYKRRWVYVMNEDGEIVLRRADKYGEQYGITLSDNYLKKDEEEVLCEVFNVFKKTLERINEHRIKVVVGEIEIKPEGSLKSIIESYSNTEC